MKFFGRKSAGRGAVRPELARGFSGGVAYGWGAGGSVLDRSAQGEWPRGYEAQLRDGYLGNVVAQRAVRLVAEGISSAALCASDDRILALVKTRSAGQALLENLAAHLLLHGNGFVQIIRDGDDNPAELFALRPERVTLEPDAQGWPATFVYRVGDRVMRFPALDAQGRPHVVQIKAFHPADDHYGLGCLGVAAGAIAIHNAATRWNKALLDNAARPSGALVYDPGDGAVMSAAQFDRLKTEMEAGFAGANNAGRPMLLEGGLRWQALSLSPADMDFVALKAAAARDIALAFGVPPMLLGLPGDATYANYREANKALWRHAILPLAGKILDAVAEGVGMWWPGTAISVDMDQVPALAEDRERLWTQVAAADFLSREEKRAMLGI